MLITFLSPCSELQPLAQYTSQIAETAQQYEQQDPRLHMAS